MKATGAAIIFHVSDLEAAVKYYTEILGFKVEFRFDELVGVEYDNVLIHLSGPNPAAVKKTIGEGHIYIFCDEVDQYFQDISAKGALATAKPDDRIYGMRDFGIKDPDGNVLAFGKEISH